MVEGVFKACEIRYSRLNEEELHCLLYKLLNPKRADTLPMPVFRKNEALNRPALIQLSQGIFRGL